MICCDRCEEWFHGDCVGITEARGRLLERNGEDYICPNCTVQKSRSASPASASEGEKRPARRASHNSTAEHAAAPAGAEDKPGEDLGIKGRIEKATNPSGKKKIKIFQPVCRVSRVGLLRCFFFGGRVDRLTTLKHSLQLSVKEIPVNMSCFFLFLLYGYVLGCVLDMLELINRPWKPQ